MKKTLDDLSNLNLKAPLINIFDLPHFIESAKSVSLKKSELVIINAIVSVLQKKPREYISITEVCEYTNRKETTVRQLLNTIHGHGLFSLEYCNVSKSVMRRSKIYAFTNKTFLANPISSSSDVSSIDLTDINQSYIAKGDELHGKMDPIITSFLFTALQFNRKGKLKENSVNTYLADNDMLNVKAVSKSDNVVAYVKDIRIYLAVLKLVHDIICNRIILYKQSYLQFEDVLSTVFDIRGVDILVTMGQGDGSGERNNLNAAMLRLDSTGYVIKAPEWFTRKHGLSSGTSRVDHFRIRFNAETQTNLLIYKIELDQSMVKQFYQEIIDDRSMLTFTDPQLFAIKNDFSFAFLLACQRIRHGKVTQLSWSEMKDMFAPGLPLKEFKKKLTSMLEKNVVVQDNKEKTRLWVIAEQSGVVLECECLYSNVSITLYDGDFQLIRSPSMKVLANTFSKRSAQAFRKELR